MTSINKVILMGNLTRDPELRYTPSGTAVANFGMAMNRKYGSGDDQKEDVCFVDVVAFGKTGELAEEYLSKGRLVAIDGRLQFRQWEGQDGGKRSKLEVVCERLHFLPNGERNGGGGGRRGGRDDAPPLDDDDIPF